VSPALPQISGREVVRALESVGFVHSSTKGSHAKLRHPDGRVVIVPLHRTLARGTLAIHSASSGGDRDPARRAVGLISLPTAVGDQMNCVGKRRGGSAAAGRLSDVKSPIWFT
jgi:predicted RNA binding protein YcfA (HicA-like mRNA interferase family)